jgi:hypothetical protein
MSKRFVELKASSCFLSIGFLEIANAVEGGLQFTFPHQVVVVVVVEAEVIKLKSCS